MKTKNKHLLFLTAIVLVAATVQIAFNPDATEEAAATTFCVTQKCKAAEAAEREATAKANNASAAANTLDAEVKRLGQEIEMYEARIVKNQAEAEDLRVEIEENTKKLELQQQALLDMLINMHFEGQTDAIMLLASSDSLSDYAEKQSRADTAKEQISISAQTVKGIKEDLEAQKAEVERIIADQELQRKAVEENKKTQQALLAQYKANAAAYSKDAEKARQAKEDEISAEIARLNSSGAKGNGSNTYPFAKNCPRDNLRYSAYGGYVCQCTSYAGWKAYEAWGVTISAWGNAYSWAISASSLGYKVDYSPAPGTVAVSTAGAWGHVMWVESVNSNGTINLSEYNNAYSAASGVPGDFGYRIGVSPAGLQFIHFH